jgi:hypothetical protein
MVGRLALTVALWCGISILYSLPVWPPGSKNAESFVGVGGKWEGGSGGNIEVAISKTQEAYRKVSANTDNGTTTQPSKAFIRWQQNGSRV